MILSATPFILAVRCVCEEALSWEMGGGYNKPSHPLIEDEDDFEAVSVMPAPGLKRL